MGDVKIPVAAKCESIITFSDGDLQGPIGVVPVDTIRPPNGPVFQPEGLLVWMGSGCTVLSGPLPHPVRLRLDTLLEDRCDLRGHKSSGDVEMHTPRHD